MREPEKQTGESLLKSVHSEGIPHWTIKQQIEAYRELSSLYSHWFRIEPITRRDK